MSTLVVVYELEGNGRKIVSDALDGAAEAIYLPDLDDAGRAEALRNADAVLARTTRELRQGEIAAEFLRGIELHRREPAATPQAREHGLTIDYADGEVLAFGHEPRLGRAHLRLGSAALRGGAAAPTRMRARANGRLGANGVNLVNACGAAAWQTVFHCHVHVIPRYEGDPLKLPWVPAPGDPQEIAAAAQELGRG